MDYSLEYKKMCYKAVELQNMWQINDGDLFILKASYCTQCNEDDLCDICLEMDNTYSIGGSHYDKYYLFNPTLCVRGDGCRINSTTASIMVTDNKYIEDIQPYNTHVKNVVWMPRQEDLQKLVASEECLSLYGLTAEFKNYVFKEKFNTFEKYWLAFAMSLLYGKQWDGTDWILMKEH